MSSRRPQIVKSTVKAASGGIIAIAALMALMFLRGGGSGSGDTQPENFVSSETPMVSTDTESKVDLTIPAAEPTTDTLSPEEKKALSGEMLSILIDEHSYLMVVPGDTTLYRPTDLSRLTVLAGLANGDSNGIRVKILRRESSRTQAEVDLKAALAEAGIGEDAVYMPAEFVE